MILTVRHALRYYKRYKVDTWGAVKTKVIIPNLEDDKNYNLLNPDENEFFSLLNLQNLIKKKSNIYLNYLTFLYYNNKLINSIKKLNNLQFILFNYITKLLIFQMETISYKTFYLLKYFYFRYLDQLEKRNMKKKDFYFRIDIINPEKIERKISKKITSLRLLKLFYLILSEQNFKRLSKRAWRTRGNYQTNYLYFLECRLGSIFYRCTFADNMFTNVRLALEKCIWVNKEIKIFKNSKVPLMTFFGIRYCLKGFFYWDLWKRLRRRSIIFNVPRFIFNSLSLFASALIRFPKKNDLVYLLI